MLKVSYNLTLASFYAIIPGIKPLLPGWFFDPSMNLKTAVIWLTQPYYGSNRLSRLVRTKIEKRPVAELIGIPLIALAFLTGVVLPQTVSGFSTAEVYFDTQVTTIDAVVAPSRFRWPLATFGISQYFTGGHRGLDLTNPAGTPIYPVTDGKVIFSGAVSGGYGKHVIVAHDNGMTSTYAHMSRLNAVMGQIVTKDTELGTVGATGWATGNHLHLEVYQNGVALNPMEILPDIKKYEPRDISQATGESSLPGFSL